MIVLTTEPGRATCLEEALAAGGEIYNPHSVRLCGQNGNIPITFFPDFGAVLIRCFLTGRFQ
jgi:hypothetical protein